MAAIRIRQLHQQLPARAANVGSAAPISRRSRGTSVAGAILICPAVQGAVAAGWTFTKLGGLGAGLAPHPTASLSPAAHSTTPAAGGQFSTGLDTSQISQRDGQGGGCPADLGSLVRGEVRPGIGVTTGNDQQVANQRLSSSSGGTWKAITRSLSQSKPPGSSISPLISRQTSQVSTRVTLHREVSR